MHHGFWMVSKSEKEHDDKVASSRQDELYNKVMTQMRNNSTDVEVTDYLDKAGEVIKTRMKFCWMGDPA